MTPEQIQLVVDDAQKTVTDFYARHGYDNDVLRALFGSVLGYYLGGVGRETTLNLLADAITRVMKTRLPEDRPQ